ncbi:acetyltransferase (isoleucine patch superfamily) [Rheinheimera sp. A13L]|uniref:acyltransferase n=1 Tax=Rheinheimera sp. A13L TaxID=506534 RepID=UPI00021254AC|nr:acyltransferase [Rheinheimera sp. A13L]EGM78168.1 acetyltransferase (isoleucine patch superfamily) [Rheinheimera sp. A13L]
MLNKKVLWMFRALLYKSFFGRFGMLSYIGKPLYLLNVKNVFIGSRVRLYPGARIETFDSGTIHIGNNVSVGQCLHIISGVGINVGDDVTVSANVFISDVEHQYEGIGVHIMEQPLTKAEVVVGENSFLGYGCVIRAGTVLGRHCIVGANSVVKGVFPDYCVIAGNPAKIIKQYNAVTNTWDRFKG